ncbi:hypothetical protein PHLCEN_2v3067 [Hermanssonia centrifuga]|uniref:Uncharacterized protein n=1 Tax=Hermanssonia centrifuga TaxID=98765 RepID=A0A2R6R7B3_9APHY|nr:hypothetical protein PHLCEN_2v3067 [Hermanssonia centrifuga]
MERVLAQETRVTRRALALMTWILGAEHSLTLNELAESVAIEEMVDGHWQQDKVVESPRQLVANCTELCYITEKDTIILTHSSVGDFLLKHRMVENELFSYFPKKIRRTCISSLRRVVSGNWNFDLLMTQMKSPTLQSHRQSSGRQDILLLTPTHGYFTTKGMLPKRITTSCVVEGKQSGINLWDIFPTNRQTCRIEFKVPFQVQILSLEIIVPWIPHGAEAIELFRALDVENSGLVTLAELLNAYTNPDDTRFSKSTIRTLLNKFDMDGIGALTDVQFKELHKCDPSLDGMFRVFR